MFTNIFIKIKNRLASHKKLIAKYKAPKTLFIYQMGKVGSTTLENSLPNAVHIHAFFTKNHTCPVRLHGQAKFGVKYFFYRVEQELLAYLLRRAFKQRQNTKVITLVREPLARNISMFFHDLDAYLFAAHTNCLNTRQVALPTRSQQKSMLADAFEKEFDQNYVFNWFDNELRRMTGINIYQFPFDRKKGFGCVNYKNVELICIRTDKLKQCLEPLSEFVGDSIILSDSNHATSKWYGDIYQEFKKQYQPNAKWLDQAKKSKLTQHFFN